MNTIAMNGKMHTLITFATNWGCKYGGINSFNTDFLSAFGVAYHFNVQVICIVATADTEEIEEANKVYVRLVPLPYAPQDKVFTPDHGQAGNDELKRQDISFDPEMIVWLGHDRITGAAAIAAAKAAGGRSALIHHMSYDHYESYAENSQTAYKKTQEQIDLFKKADIVLAVGPLLRDALKDLLFASKPVYTLIPGLAEIVPVEAPITFTAFLSGRLSDDASRIKQGHLGIAAFAKAHREAHENGMPQGLCSQPKLVLRGIDFDAQIVKSLGQFPSDPETELKRFAENYANGVINLLTLPYTQDRETLYNDLKRASVALMPSWHEGFGLVAWEAIAAGVPLIISKKSGAYQLLEEKYPGAGTGCVHAIDVRGAIDSPFFHPDDLQAVVAALKAVANNPAKARQKAAVLRNMIGEFTWSTCAAQGASAFGWALQKGSMPITTTRPFEKSSRDKEPTIDAPSSLGPSPLQIPLKCWKLGIGIAESQLLRAEESIVPFDPARQPELDVLNCWLDDTQWPQAVRLITGAGGLGKTRLALKLCQLRLTAGWQAGFLDIAIDAKDMATNWQTLRNFGQPLLIIIDYAETRQTVLIALIRAILQKPVDQTVRILLLARNGGEWWDNLPSKDHQAEPLLSGYATSGPFRLSALHATVPDRDQAYRLALHAYAQALGVTVPDMIPELAGEHFERPLYVQMLALLALHGERPTTAEGLTTALLNHERRYWHRLLSHFGWAEPEQIALQLLALATLAGGFATPRIAEPYWAKANGNLRYADFNALFQALVPLYPGKQGLQAIRPDLLGEALVAQALLRPEGTDLLDAVLSNSAGASVRRHALTVLARLSGQRLDLHDMLVDAIIRHFAHCYQEMIVVAIETPGRMSTLAEVAFTRLPPASKSQVAGLLEPFFREESVQLTALSCFVMEFLVAKYRQRLSKKSTHLKSKIDYATALDNYSLCLRRIGRHEQALSCAQEAVKLFERLNPKDQQSCAFDYADSLSNYAVHLNDAGHNEESLKYEQKAIDIHHRLARKNPDRYGPHYATSLNNYAIYLSDAGQNEESLKYDQEALEIRRRLAQKDPVRYEPDYVRSLGNYSSHLSKMGQNETALRYARQAIDIQYQLAQRAPDRYEPDYADSLIAYSSYLSDAGHNEEALKHALEALKINSRLTQKSPDRYEPDYSISLNNYSNRLSDTGQYEEAIKYALVALEIRRRLAQKTPDRYEPGYALSLNNYSNRLNDAGQYGEALTYARQSLEIRRRLATRAPERFDGDLFGIVCSVYFINWLCDTPDIKKDLPDLNFIPTTIPIHRRALFLLFASFVKACLAGEPTSRNENFKIVLTTWDNLSLADKNRVRCYWLCATAWCATVAPDAVANLDWQASWHQYTSQRQGQLPHWMQEVARRLAFRWPA